MLLHGVLAGASGVLDALQAAGVLYCTAGWVLAGVGGEELQVWGAGVPGVLLAFPGGAGG